MILTSITEDGMTIMKPILMSFYSRRTGNKDMRPKGIKDKKVISNTPYLVLMARIMKSEAKDYTKGNIPEYMHRDFLECDLVRLSRRVTNEFNNIKHERYV